MTEPSIGALTEQLAQEELAVTMRRDRVRAARSKRAARANEKILAEQREAEVGEEEVLVRAVPVRKQREEH